jgi:hypothetical protein
MTRWSYRKYCNIKNLIRPFNGSDFITYNYAESDQDIFVLSMLDGLKNGTYLELGAAWPNENNNTALLEECFGWTGISIDKNQKFQRMWEQANRTMIASDAMKIDYNSLLTGMPEVIDYLSLDCDPSVITFSILRKLPLDKYKFRVVTFEHDCYRDGPMVKMASRKYLESYGYKLVVSNVAHGRLDYEDWYVHPDLVDPKKIESHLQIDDSVKDYQSYLYN